MPARLFAGPYPGARAEPQAEAQLRAILGAGVSAFLDLTQAGEYSLPPYAELAGRIAGDTGSVLAYRRAPIEDQSVPDIAAMREILGTLELWLDAGRTIYVHCFAGIGRTGTVIGCHFVERGLSGNEALTQIAALRRGLGNAQWQSPETEAQRGFVLNWMKQT